MRPVFAGVSGDRVMAGLSSGLRSVWKPARCLAEGWKQQVLRPEALMSAQHCEVVQRLLGLREMEKALGGGGLGLHSLEANEGPQQDRREPLLVRVARRTDHSGFCHCKGTASAPGLGSSTVPPRRKCTKRAEGGRLVRSSTTQAWREGPWWKRYLSQNIKLKRVLHCLNPKTQFPP